MGKAQNAVRKHKRAYKRAKELHKNNKGFGKLRQKARHAIPTVLDRGERRRGKERKRKTKEAVRKEARQVRNEESKDKN